MGSLTVDRATVAGLHVQRQHLVDDIADSLGSVLEASRLGIELERQLRAVRRMRRRSPSPDAGWWRRWTPSAAASNGTCTMERSTISCRCGCPSGWSNTRSQQAGSTRRRSRWTGSRNRSTSPSRSWRRTATGVSSPLLAQHGLVDALKQELAARPARRPAHHERDRPGRRFPAGIESAVWFCCLEAVNNARKYARGALIGLSLRAEPGRLEFGVHDDGPGWDMSRRRRLAGSRHAQRHRPRHRS